MKDDEFQHQSDHYREQGVPEKQITGKPGRPKGVEILGVKRAEPGQPEIIDGRTRSDAALRTLDSRHGDEGQTEVEAVVHDSKEKFKEEIDK